MDKYWGCLLDVIVPSNARRGPNLPHSSLLHGIGRAARSQSERWSLGPHGTPSQSLSSSTWTTHTQTLKPPHITLTHASHISTTNIYIFSSSLGSDLPAAILPFPLVLVRYIKTNPGPTTVDIFPTCKTHVTSSRARIYRLFGRYWPIDLKNKRLLAFYELYHVGKFREDQFKIVICRWLTN